MQRVTTSFKSFRQILLWSLGLLLILGIGGSIALSYHISSKFLQRPTYSCQTQDDRAQRYQWLKNNMQAADVAIRTSDNERLAGLIIIRPHAKRAILACHGYGRFKEDIWRVTQLFPNDTILFFDFRAHGFSSGSLISIGYHEQKDIAAAVEFLQHEPQTKNLPIIGIGFSMGGAALLGAAAAGIPFQALIIDSSFDRLDKQIKRVFTRKTNLPLFPFFYISSWFFWLRNGMSMSAIQPSAWAQHINSPMLFIHSSDDTFTPSKTSQKLSAKTSAPHQTWFGNNAEHAELLTANFHDYQKTVQQFLHTFSL